MNPMPITPRISNKIANMGIVCAILVVALHCKADFLEGSFVWYFHHLFVESFGSLAVPFFFVVSGFLLAGHMHEDDWWLKATKKRFWSLGVPYVTWCCIYLLFICGITMVANLLAGADSGRNINMTGEDLLKAFGVDIRGNPINAPLWYVRALIGFVVVSPLLKRLANIPGVIFLMCVYAYACCRYVRIDDDNWLCRELLVSVDCIKGLTYFTAGLFIRLRLKANLFAGRWRVPLYSFAVVLLGAYVLAVVGHFDGRVQMQAKWLFIPLGGYVAFDVMPDWKWPKFLTSAAFPVYVVHYAVITVVSLAFKSLIPPGRSIFSFALYFMAIIGMSFGIVWTIRKFAPKLAALVFGGR